MDFVKYLNKVNRGTLDYYKRVAEWLNTHFTKDEGAEFDTLDLGCGCCEMGDFLSDLGHNVTFADAEQYRDDVIPCNLEGRLPFEDHSFDIIVMWNVVEHLKSFNWIYECHRILRKGGILIVLCPEWKSGHKRFYDTITHFTPWTLKRMKELVKRTDFEVLELRHFANIPKLWRYILKAFDYNLPFKRKSVFGVFKKWYV